jgi:hypothetical protein
MIILGLRLYDMQRILIVTNRPISWACSMGGFCLLILSIGMRVHGRGDYEFHRSRNAFRKRRLVLRCRVVHRDISGQRLFLTIIRQRLTFQS